MARKRQSTKNTGGRNKLDLSNLVANTSTKKESTNEATKKLEANPRIDQLEQQLQAHEREIQSNMAKLKQDTQALKDRKQDILDRQQALLQQNGGTQVAGHDIIRLNVSGTEMFARRDTLTVVEGSRLEALFSGRWENQLMRDALGRVFMDVEIDAFKKILEYLYMVKLSRSVAADSSEKGGDKKGETDPLLLHIELKADQEAFDKYMNFFRLRDNKSKAGCSAKVDNKTADASSLKDIIQHERAILDVMEKELDEVEKRLSAEESFVKLFLADDSAYSHSLSGSSFLSPHDSSSHFSSDISSDTSSIVDVTHGNSQGVLKQDISHSIHDEDLGILNLLVAGEILVVKRSTLCHDPNSKLAQDFSNDEWLQEHLVVTEQGKRCFLVEQPLSAFQKVLRHIRLQTVSSDEDALPLIKIDYNSKSNDVFIRMYDYYFPGVGPNVIEIDKSPCMDSVIIEKSSDVDKLQEWLKSVNHNAAPKLLYRASRDGWGANDFHRACDGKGATITIVKSSGGYIFGGFTDKSWSSNGGYESSDNAFLFHLKCHSGVPAEKYGMRKDNNGGYARYAMYSHRSHGPTFGYGVWNGSYYFELQIVSNAKFSYSNCRGIGNSYTSFAWNNRQSSFLTGSTRFKVSEYEVFQV